MDDEAAELREALHTAGFHDIAVPDDWPRLAPPAPGGEPVRAYFLRAVLGHPLVAALQGAFAAAGSRDPLQIPGTYRSTECTSFGWEAADRGAPPRSFHSSDWDRQRALQYHAHRCVGRLAVAFFDAQRAGEFEADGRRTDQKDMRKEPVPHEAWDHPAYTLDLKSEGFAPAGGGLDLPSFHAVRVFRGGLSPGALRWPAGVPEADGLPLDRAWREMAPPAVAEELRALEAKGYPSPFVGLIHQPTTEDERARNLVERLRARLRGELAAEARYVAVGIWTDGAARVPGAWFRLPDPGLSWDEARVQHAGLALTALRVFPVEAAPSAGSADEVLAGLVRADSAPAAGVDGVTRPKDRGGASRCEFRSDQDRNALRRYAERHPDGLPKAGKELRDLVRSTCLASCSGRSPRTVRCSTS